MTRLPGNVDHLAALGDIGRGDPDDRLLSAWGAVAASADEDAGFEDDLFPLADDDWSGEWGAARLGIP